MVAEIENKEWKKNIQQIKYENIWIQRWEIKCTE